MTNDEFRLGLARLGLARPVVAAEALGVDDRTVRRWLDGSRRVPGPVQRLLATLEQLQGLTLPAT